MPADYVIGVDCSTTAAKAVVWNARGESLSESRMPFDLQQPHRGWGEQNAEDWWTATSDAIRRAVQTVDTARIGALSLTHQRESFVCLDQRGQPLRPAMLWLDVRATEQVQQFGTDEVHAITGKPPNPTPAWYKLLWLAQHEPDTLSRAAKVVDVHGFLIHRLTGRWMTSWASADPLGVVDMSTFDYDDGLITTAGLNRSQFPELCPPGTIIAELDAQTAGHLGLPAGLPVVAGAGDGQCAQLGSGVIAAGRASLNLGSGVVSGIHSADYQYGPEFRTLAAAFPGNYSLETFMGGGAVTVGWFIRNLAGVDPQALGLDLTAEQVLETAAAQLPPGAEGLLLLPYWTGALTPYWDHHARGILLGLSGIHGKGHIYRAILEGVAFEQRLLTSGAEQALGTRIDEIVALGGGSRSAVWCQIISDVMQRRVCVVEEPESTCLGAGMLAAAAIGMHPSIPTAALEMSGLSRVYEPQHDVAEVYDRLFGAYREMYPANRDLFSKLAAVL